MGLWKYFLIAEVPEAIAEHKSTRLCAWRAAAGPVVAAVLAAGATAVWITGRVQRPRYEPKSMLEEKFNQGYPSQCGKMEPNVEYIVENVWYTNLDHIPTAEMCCAMCQGNSRCMSFTWVQNAGLAGCPSQCWLKGGTPQRSQHKVGTVSGIPPPRKAFPGVPSAPARPGLLCFSLMVPHGTEPSLIAWQSENRASIFACDATAVYSNVIMTIGSVTTRMVDSDLKCQYGGDSQSALNAWIFIAVWRAVINDQTYKLYDWTVKVDPDAVFFPDRLKSVLVSHAGSPYVNNCHYGMHGPIEVLGRVAVARLEQGYRSSYDGKTPHECVEKLVFGQWGEDMFLDQCLSKVYKLQAPTEPRLMCEDHCDCPDFYWCSKSNYHVSFHPFKSVDAYSNCIANALAGAPAPPPVLASTLPPTYYNAVPAPLPAQLAFSPYTPVPVPVPAPSYS